MAWLTAAGTLGVLTLVALIAVLFLYFGPGPAARNGDQTVVALPSGSGVAAIGARLKQAGVIRSADMFRVAVSLTGADRRLRAGEYEVPSRASLATVVNLLVDGKVVRHYVTLPEGWSSAQAVDILMRNEVLTGEVETPPEGSLWPETYEVMRGDTRASVVARMKRARDDRLAALWAERSPDTVVRTAEDAVILASIVEKETAVAAERPRVAGVFTNRLRQGMRLESDPTIVYGITQGRPLGRGIRLSELQATTPWNTYRIDGLPRTAIANPGEEALKAVLNPLRTEDLFFVADGTGGHAFARTYQEHLSNVARWRAIERARAGLPADAPPPAVEGTVPGVPNASPADAEAGSPPPGQAVITVNPAPAR